MSNKGLDLGTNMIVASFLNEDGKQVFKKQRDALYTIIPKSEINKNSIKMALEKRGASFITEGDIFTVIGEDALKIAIERNSVAERPMRKGVLSAKQKNALPMLKLIIESLIGKGVKGDKVVFSCPANPIDNNFNITYHVEMFKTYLNELGYEAYPINEAFSIAISELIDEALTGITISWGAGQTNIAVIHQGDVLVEFSLAKAGDFIDESVGLALDLPSSMIQLEKEIGGVDLFNPKGKIQEAVGVYYSSLINYVFNNVAYELNRRKKELPIFREPIQVIVSGGLTLAKGFVKKVGMCMKNVDFPIKIKGIRRAENPLFCVANGCFLASNL